MGLSQRQRGNMEMNKRPKSATVRAKITDRYTDPPKRSWRELITDPELNTVMALSLIGLLVTLNLISRFPDIAAVIAQCDQF
jgi:hypothetical protein